MPKQVTKALLFGAKHPIVERVRPVLSLLLFASLAVGQSQPPTPSPAKSSEKDEQGRAPVNNPSPAVQHTPQQAPVIHNFYQAPGGQPMTKDFGENSHYPTSTDWWLVFFTGILAICALVQFFTTRSQIKLTRDSLDISKRSADAAWANAEALMNGDQAWIKVTDILDPEAGVPGFTFNFINGGKTAATLTGLMGNSALAPPGDSPFPEPVNYAGAQHHVWGKEAGYELLLYPTRRLSSYMGIPLPVGIDPEAIRRGEARLYVFGLLSYRDCFNRTKRLQIRLHVPSSATANPRPHDSCPMGCYSTRCLQSPFLAAPIPACPLERMM